MSGHGDPVDPSDFSAQSWEGRYRSVQPTSPDAPHPSLVVETDSLVPGQALDAGCGRGANAIWLASRGWQVTAVDVSATALDDARERSHAPGDEITDRITWLHADLASWDPDGRLFDLVTSSYVHLPGPAEELFARLASWVAPGGTLLVAGHAAVAGHAVVHDLDLDLDHGHGHGGPAHPPAAQLRVEQVTAVLPADQWEIAVAEPRTREVDRPDGSGVVSLRDVVVCARRTGLQRH